MLNEDSQLNRIKDNPSREEQLNYIKELQNPFNASSYLKLRQVRALEEIAEALEGIEEALKYANDVKEGFRA